MADVISARARHGVAVTKDEYTSDDAPIVEGLGTATFIQLKRKGGVSK